LFTPEAESAEAETENLVDFERRKRRVWGKGGREVRAAILVRKEKTLTICYAKERVFVDEKLGSFVASAALVDSGKWRLFSGLVLLSEVQKYLSYQFLQHYDTKFERVYHTCGVLKILV
jgi:hypothetical protein